MHEPYIRAPFVDASAAAQLSDSNSKRKAVFLDRDGVINVDSGYVHLPDETVFMPGIFDRAKTWLRDGYILVVVTNQAGIARGLYSESDFIEFTKWVHLQFSERGAPLIATYYCPHHPSAGRSPLTVDCECRKPRPGMIKAAIDEFRIDPASSLLVGDKRSDLAAGNAAGIEKLIFLGEGTIE